jgi:hypothetical protein
LAELPVPLKVLLSAILLTLALALIGTLGQIIVHDIILVGTDGIREACDDNGTMFGKENLQTIVRRHRDVRVQVLIDAVFDAVRQHSGDAKPADDMTRVVVKFEGTDISSAP